MGDDILSILDAFGARLQSLKAQVRPVVPPDDDRQRRASRRHQQPTAPVADLRDDVDELVAGFRLIREIFLARHGEKRAGQVSTTPKARAIRASSLPSRPTPGAPAPAPPSTAKPAFALAPEEMGDGIIYHLARFAADARFGSTIDVQPLEADLPALLEHFPYSDPKHDLWFVEWSQDKDDREDGVSRLYLVERPVDEWHLAGLSKITDRPSAADARAFLETMATSPPKGPIPYYVGPTWSTAFENVLSAGAQLDKLVKLPGVNTLYCHLGKKASGTALHCEDAALRSCNLVVGPGYKIWLMVHPDDSEKLEKFVPRYGAMTDCGQAVRHLNLFLPPSVLEQARIRFEVIVAGQTDLVVTRPRQYHLVVNFTDCLAVSINYLHPGEPVFPEDVAACEACGLFCVDHPSIRHIGATDAESTDPEEDGPRTTTLKRKATVTPRACRKSPKKPRLVDPSAPSQPRPAAKATPASDNNTANTVSKHTDPATVEETTRPAEAKTPPASTNAATTREPRLAEEEDPSVETLLTELQAVLNNAKSIDKHCNLPTLDRTSLPPPHVLRLACALRGRRVIGQLYDLVKAARSTTLKHHLRLPRISPSGGYAEHKKCLRGIQGTEQDIILPKLCLRICKMYLYDDANRCRMGAERMSSDDLAKILGELRMDRYTYKRHRFEGEHWRRICGKASEWLAYIVPFQKFDFKASFTQFRDLTDDEIKALHALLVDDYAAALKKAVDALHISLLPGADPVEFAWEYNAGVRAHDPREPTSPETCTGPELLRRLAPLWPVKANIWNADRFVNTPAPPGWPEASPWPSDPTALEAACRQCDFCDGLECACAQRVNGPTPFRIVDYDNGRGIEAIAHDEAVGQAQKPPAHLKGELLGLLAGEIYPLVSTEEPAHWSFDFYRPDFEGDGAVCQIRLATVASCFRLLSVATQPTARLTKGRLGGRWVIAVVAERDIKDGEQITVSSLPWKRNT